MRHAAAALLAVALTAGMPAHAQQGGQSSRLLPLPSTGRGLTFGLHWDSDVYADVAGGSRRGYATDSVASAALGLDTGKLGAWQGGTVQFGLQSITSTHPSAWVGDAQGVSNLEAPNRRQVSALWYAQDLGGAKVRGGIMDVNRFFAVTDAAGMLTNASFGISPTLTLDAPTPTYPAPAWGLMARLGHPDNAWLLGLYEADPEHRSTALRGGSYLIAERDWHRPATGSHVGVGAWYRRAGGTSPAPASDWGAYANLERDLPGLPGVKAFVQFAASPSQVNAIPAYLGAGIHVSRVSSTVTQLSFGMARAWIRGHTAETSVEATALIPVGSATGVALQPDLQYVFHPSGVHPNALVLALRLHVALY